MEDYFWREPAWLGALGCMCKKLGCVITFSSSLHCPWLFLICFSSQVSGIWWEDWNLSDGEGGERCEEEEELTAGSGGGNVPALLCLAVLCFPGSYRS